MIGSEEAMEAFLSDDSYCKTGTNFLNFYKDFDIPSASCIPDNNDFEKMLVIRTHVHIVRKSDGTQGRSLTDVNSAIVDLKNVFNPYGIDFLVDEILYINDDATFNSPFERCGRWEDENCPFIRNETNCSALDIFVLDNPITSPGLDWNGGIASGIPSLALALGGEINGYDVLDYNIMAHEVGHALGLFHTHHGTCEGSQGVDLDICGELVDGSNCCECGDFVCDTDASPFLVNTSANCLPPTPAASCNTLDANGDMFVPQEDNIMSYNSPFCLDKFTNDQASRMRYYIRNHPVVRRALIDGPGQNIDDAPLIISGVNTWKNEEYVIKDNNLIIPSGSTLIIDNCYLRFADAEIIVEEGARLIINGQSVLTRYECQSNYWGGIRVLGDFNVTHPALLSSNPAVQYPNHGLLEISEFANIEHAHTGARSLEYFVGVGWRGAGIIRIENTEFKYCKHSILLGEISAHKHLVESSSFFNPSALNHPSEIVSSGQTLIFGNQIIQVQLLNLDKIEIENCGFNIFPSGFSGLFSAPTSNVNSHTYGIVSTNTDLYVKDCNFSFLFNGIVVYDNYSSKTSIKGCEFEGNRGVSLSGTFNAEIIDNLFTVNTQGLFSSYGIYLYDSFGFGIKENIFFGFKWSSWTSIEEQFGLVIQNSKSTPVSSGPLGQFPNEIFENTFSFIGLEDEFRGATVIQGQHNDLDFKCNYYNTEYRADWLLMDNIDPVTLNPLNDFSINDLGLCNAITSLSEPIVQQWHIANTVGNPLSNHYHIENLSNNGLNDIVWDEVEPIYFGGIGSVSTGPNCSSTITCDVVLDNNLKPALPEGLTCEEYLINYTEEDLFDEIKRLSEEGSKEQLNIILDCIDKPWSNTVLASRCIKEREGETALLYANKLPENTQDEIDFKDYFIVRAQEIIGGSGKQELLRNSINDFSQYPYNKVVRTLAESYLASQNGTIYSRDILLPNNKIENTLTNQSLLSLVFYPNPANRFVRIDVDEVYKASGDLKLSIFNCVGANVLETIYTEETTIDLTELPGGLYIVSITSETGDFIASGKLQVNH